MWSVDDQNGASINTDAGGRPQEEKDDATHDTNGRERTEHNYDRESNRGTVTMMGKMIKLGIIVFVGLVGLLLVVPTGLTSLLLTVVAIVAIGGSLR